MTSPHFFSYRNPFSAGLRGANHRDNDPMFNGYGHESAKRFHKQKPLVRSVMSSCTPPLPRPAISQLTGGHARPSPSWPARRRLPTNRGYPDAGFPTRAVSRSRSAFAGCVTHRLAPFVTLDFCLAKGPLCYSREGNKPLPGGKTDPKGLKASGLMYTAPMLVPKLKAGSKSSPPDSRIGYGLSRKG